MAAWSKHELWTVKPLSISIWSGQEQCRGSVCARARTHAWGLEGQIRKCQRAHTLSQNFFSCRSNPFPQHTGRGINQGFWMSVDSFSQSCFLHRSEMLVCSHFNSYDNMVIHESFNECRSLSHFYWGKLKVVDGSALSVGDTVDESPHSVQLCPSVFFISGKKERASGSFQAPSRQFFIDPSDGETN